MGATYMKQTEIENHAIDLGLCGSGNGTVIPCDLTHRVYHINAATIARGRSQSFERTFVGPVKIWVAAALIDRAMAGVVHTTAPKGKDHGRVMDFRRKSRTRRKPEDRKTLVR